MVLKKILNSQDKKRLLSNFFYLLISQGFNYLLPLITFPYLARVLGPEKFGLIAFVQAFIQYFVIFTDFGFSLSATREVSIYREDKKKLEEIFNAVIFIKLILIIISFIILLLIIFSFEKFRQYWQIYILAFGMVIGQALFPGWFFQGLEKVKYIAILHIISKLFFSILIFIFVKNQVDFWKVPLLNSLGFILSALIALGSILNKFKMTFKIPKLKLILFELKESFYIFISNLSISLYTISTTFILGLVSNTNIVGYYSSAEKVIRTIQTLYKPLSQAIYPYINKLIYINKNYGIKFLQVLTIIYGIIGLIISLLTYLFAEKIIYFLFGNSYRESIIVLKILSFLPFLTSMSNIFGIQTMLSFNYKKSFFTILCLGGLINISLLLILVPKYQHLGAAISILITELFITLAMLSFLYIKGIRILEGKIV